jgi:hypothetical protein
VISTFMAFPSSSVFGLIMAVVARRSGAKDVKFLFIGVWDLECNGFLVLPWCVYGEIALGSRKSNTGSVVVWMCLGGASSRNVWTAEDLLEAPIFKHLRAIVWVAMIFCIREIRCCLLWR